MKLLGTAKDHVMTYPLEYFDIYDSWGLRALEIELELIQEKTFELPSDKEAAIARYKEVIAYVTAKLYHSSHVY